MKKRSTTHWRIALLTCLAAAIGIPVGLATGAGADEAVPPDGPTEQETAAMVVENRTGIPTEIVLDACLDVQEKGTALPTFCPELLADEDEIRAAADQLPEGYPSSEDFGLGDAATSEEVGK